MVSDNSLCGSCEKAHALEALLWMQQVGRMWRFVQKGGTLGRGSARPQCSYIFPHYYCMNHLLVSHTPLFALSGQGGCPSGAPGHLVTPGALLKCMVHGEDPGEMAVEEEVRTGESGV